MLKIIFTTLIFTSISAVAQIDCPAKSQKNVELRFIKCETPASYALPKYNYTSQSGEAIEYKKTLTVSGYVTAATGSPIQFNTPKLLDGDLMFAADLEKNYSQILSEVFEYNGFKLRNAKKGQTNATAAIVPTYHVPYLIPEAKISLLKTDALNCEFVKGDVPVEVTCSIHRIDQGQYDCSCVYQILE